MGCCNTQSATAPSGGLSKAQRQQNRIEQSRRRLRMALATGTCLVGLLAGWLTHRTGAEAVSLPFYLVSYFAGAYYAARNAFQEILKRSVNVDVLMVLAAFGAAAVGEWPEGAILLFLFSLSGTLEQFVLGRTRKAIEELMDLTPDEAVVLREGREIRLPVEELEIGDTIIVRPGEKISADGIIVNGSTTVDQSAMTGESIPVERTSGDRVFAGTLNQAGAVQISVMRGANETTLARIVKLVEEAQSEKADSQRFTDWFGARYTWVVLGGSALTFFLGWIFFGLDASNAVYKAMTVLVVASPCAVVISIPAAILSAIAAAAREGVLLKGGAHLERIAGIQAIAFDKTGTLTVGRPRVIEVLVAPGENEGRFLQLAGSAESLSEHPLAKAIVQEVTKRGIALLPSEDLQAIVGRGAVVSVSGERVFAGKSEWFTEKGTAIPAVLTDRAEALRAQGATTVFIGTERKVAGMIGLSDTLRPTAQLAIQKLRELGIRKMIMLTGDNANAARAIAGKLSIDFAADLMPEEKVAQVKKLRAEFTSVAMVGDGINDAPSLALATVGVSLGGTGTAVALETADMVLMADDLLHLPFAVELGRRSLRVIRQNLIFAFGVMLILLATTFFSELRLPFAVAGHEGSTVLVILNGLRLLRSPAKSIGSHNP